MSNVFGRVSIEGATYPIVVPLVTSTTTLTHLSLNCLSSTLQNQNQTQDPKKTLVIRIPATSPSANLVLPFNSGLYVSPQDLVADLELPNELVTSDTKSVGVQFSLAQVSAISEGSIFTLGDTLKLQDEAMSDPKLSTFRMDVKNGGFTEFEIVIVKTPTLNVFSSRVFFWNSDDTPAQIIVKWDNIMQPTIDGISFGHCKLSYNSGTNNFSAVSEDNPAYGTYEGFFWVSKNQGDDASKDSLGLLRTPSGANPNWATNMAPRPFAYAAGVLGPGVKVWLYVTGSNGISPRQIIFDISNYVATANTKYTMLITTGNGVEVSFFAGSAEIARDVEASYPGLWLRNCERKVFETPEHVDLVSCSASDGSWLITTSNTGADVQCHITPASIVNSRLEQLLGLEGANNAFNKDTITYWGSAEGTFTSAGVGSQFLGIEYPSATKLHSFRIDSASRYPGVTAPTEFNISGSNSTVFTPIQNFTKTNWISNNPVTFHITVDHIPYRYYRLTVTKMASVLGGRRSIGPSSSTATLPIVVPLETSTGTATHLNLSGLYEEQNRTSDTKKVLVIKNPSSTSPLNMALPFDQSIYTNPLDFVAEMNLPNEMTFDNESIGVRFAYGTANPIADGTVCVIGDTLALANEGTTADLKMSTYTLNMLHPTGAVGTTNYSIRVIKNNASSSVSRDFNWTSLDSPSVVVTKWQTQMRPTISTESFGHCVLQFDSVSGKFSAAYDRDLAYGSFTDVFYQVDRDFGGVGDQSKRTLGLLITNSPNLFWQTNMAPRQFPNIAQCAYYRGGVLVDGRKRLALEIVATGSLGSTKRPIHFDITRMLDDSAPTPFEADTLFTIIVTSTGILLTVGDAAILRTQEPLSTLATLVNHYPRVYRPVVRVSGDVYNGAISPVTRLQVMSNSERQLVLSDFILSDTIQATTAVNASFRGIFGPATNQTTIDVVNTIERLDNKIFGSEEHVDLVSCVATDDSWLVTTSNTGADVQYRITPASIVNVNKESPEFTNNISIVSSPDWSNSSGWKVVSSSTYLNDADFAANNAFNKDTITYWGSAEGTFTSAGVGSQFVGIEYPSATKLHSFRIDSASR
ncbi:hypothetical protein T492DRAFT_1123212 [Pavlovales sp. CCMP2436]|nr:hypothetical protein T492DRAFT_1123212 [Pavlovales sp. CCMP2436]